MGLNWRKGAETALTGIGGQLTVNYNQAQDEMKKIRMMEATSKTQLNKEKQLGLWQAERAKIKRDEDLQWAQDNAYTTSQLAGKNKAMTEEAYTAAGGKPEPKVTPEMANAEALGKLVEEVQKGGKPPTDMQVIQMQMLRGDTGGMKVTAASKATLVKAAGALAVEKYKEMSDEDAELMVTNIILSEGGSPPSTFAPGKAKAMLESAATKQYTKLYMDLLEGTKAQDTKAQEGALAGPVVTETSSAPKTSTPSDNTKGPIATIFTSPYQDALKLKRSKKTAGETVQDMGGNTPMEKYFKAKSQSLTGQ